MKIFLDIESIPLGEEPLYQFEEFAGVKAPANYKDPEKIKEYIKANEQRLVVDHTDEQFKKRDELLYEWKKGALKATRSQIVCICAMDAAGNIFSQAGNDEEDILTMFASWCVKSNASVYIGHNVAFDLQMLRTHAAKHWINAFVSMLTFEKFAKNIIDTMQLWAGVRFDDKTKLTEIAEFLGIKNLNEGTTGADVYDLYKTGKFDEIEMKCLNDVVMCKEVYERIC